MKPRLSPTILITALLAGSHAYAGPSAVAPVEVPLMTTSNNWEITLGLYGWGAGLNGDIGAAGYTAPVDISFSDILDTLDMVAMGLIEARKGPWLFQLEGLYLRNSVTVDATTPLRNTQVQANLVAKTTRLQPVVGYRIVDNGCTQLDLLAGAVYYNISNDLRFLGVNAGALATSQDDWFDPIVGVRLNQRLSEKWQLQLRGDVGGFGVNADLAWQALAMFGYDITDSSTLFLGYRHAAVDYQNGGFLYDAASSGPILGVAITW